MKNSTFYKSGFFEFQDLGSQLIGEFCDLKSNQIVLDLCAGAGGKSLHLSAILQNKGKIYATDFKPERTKTLANRANNAGCKNIEIISFEKAMFLKNLDVILIDAPCSGIGTIKRNPDVKWKLKNNDIDNYKTIQAALLEKYKSLIHKNGKLIYATCSILPSENELQIQHFLKNNPDFELVKEIKLITSNLWC
ncbi:MAG: RsmB/NOP family class I SAM-dependent RNA methyltransferase [Saprospirales bacterium]|nr:RsmB/NOP family class I SAM-dependent RNA methyltransferase [Saprospirales bacterium]